MTKYKIILQYAGRRYAGWQIQKGQRTIQGQLREALQALTGETVSVVGSGRTDSGVHASHQVSHFVLAKEIPSEKLLRALNGLLPWDIRITQVKRTAPSFHAQKDARKKRYEYRIYNGLVLSPFYQGYVYHVIPELKTETMEEAAERITGLHDFRSFAASASKVRNSNREIFLSRVRKRGHHIVYQIEGNGFLHHMVRNIVGTLVEVGLEKRPACDMERILKTKDRRNAGRTAPAHGLHLVKVWY